MMHKKSSYDFGFMCVFVCNVFFFLVSPTSHAKNAKAIHSQLAPIKCSLHKKRLNMSLYMV